jgi:hypothetical protein
LSFYVRDKYKKGRILGKNTELVVTSLCFSFALEVGGQGENEYRQLLCRSGKVYACNQYTAVPITKVEYEMSIGSDQIDKKQS